MGRVKDYYWDEICLAQSDEDRVSYDLYWYSDELTAYQEYEIILKYHEEEEEDYYGED